MSSDTSRKSFPFKVLGLAAVGTVAPFSPAPGSAGAFPLRPGPRAVARREAAA